VVTRPPPPLRPLPQRTTACAGRDPGEARLAQARLRQAARDAHGEGGGPGGPGGGGASCGTGTRRPPPPGRQLVLPHGRRLRVPHHVRGARGEAWGRPPVCGVTCTLPMPPPPAPLRSGGRPGAGAHAQGAHRGLGVRLAGAQRAAGGGLSVLVLRPALTPLTALPRRTRARSCCWGPPTP